MLLLFEPELSGRLLLAVGAGCDPAGGDGAGARGVNFSGAGSDVISNDSQSTLPLSAKEEEGWSTMT